VDYTDKLPRSYPKHSSNFSLASNTWIWICVQHLIQLLPVAIRGILPKNVRHTITRLCSFFSSICCKVIDPSKLHQLQNEIVVILCELEMFFPPSFLNIMVHLVVHLVREVRLCGLVCLR